VPTSARSNLYSAARACDGRSTIRCEANRSSDSRNSAARIDNVRVLSARERGGAHVLQLGPADVSSGPVKAPRRPTEKPARTGRKAHCAANHRLAIRLRSTAARTASHRNRPQRRPLGDGAFQQPPRCMPLPLGDLPGDHSLCGAVRRHWTAGEFPTVAVSKRRRSHGSLQVSSVPSRIYVARLYIA
jgi:hypothetical protein